ncbi:MAG: hypothetical protein ACXWW7_06510 [Nocardioides sp.]
MLGVSRAGYYAWLTRNDAPRGRAAADRLLVQEIRKIKAKFSYYGSPRVHRELPPATIMSVGTG